MKLASILTPVSFLLAAVTLSGQTQPAQYHAVRASSPITIDGSLDEAAWQSAPEITDFTQREPDEGKPPSEKTTVKVAYDDNAIYFAARLDDSRPVKTALARRDTVTESDWFRIYLDPHLDRRSGATFQVNPANVQYDATLYIDTASDSKWDAVWESATQITPTGWNVEVRIPFSQLRFPERETHTWGINFGRYISRRSEVDRLVHVPRTESGFVSRFAHLTGLTGIKPKRSIEILPYTLARADSDARIPRNDPLNDEHEFSGDIGLDLKYPLTSNMTLTGTINPDFGQVEVDPARVNLTQFELFFPEKRPFFVEGSTLFDFGGGAAEHVFAFNMSQPIFFYSRRIGRQPQGVGLLDAPYVSASDQTTILGAAKITGKTSNGWTVAVLDALTDNERGATSLGSGPADFFEIEPLSNYFVARTAKDFNEKTTAGFLFTAVNRDLSEGLEPFLRSSAYTAGVDGYRVFGKNEYVLQWMAAGTMVQGSSDAIARTQRSSARYYQRPDADHVELDASRESLSGYGGRAMFVKHSGKWQYNVQAETYSPGFETNDVGFMTRSDILATHAVGLYVNTDPTKHTRFRQIWAGKFQHWNHDGDIIQNGLNFDTYVQYLNYSRQYFWGGFELPVMDDRATRGGAVIESPRREWLGGGYGTDSRKKVVFDFSTEQLQDENGGFDHYYSTTLTYRPTSRLTMRLSSVYRDSRMTQQYVRTVADPLASATYGARYVFADLDQKVIETPLRLDYTFTSRLSLQLYLQPYAVAADYSSFKEVVRPRENAFLEYGSDVGTIAYDSLTDRYSVDPDGAGAASSFSFSDPDFNYRSLRGNAVVRWEFRPGSAVYFVWNENRENELPSGQFRLRRDLEGTFDGLSRDVFLVKVSYWWAR